MCKVYLRPLQLCSLSSVIILSTHIFRNHLDKNRTRCLKDPVVIATSNHLPFQRRHATVYECMFRSSAAGIQQRPRLSPQQYATLTLSSPVMPNGYPLKRSGPYWSNPPFLVFLHSGTLALSPERQSARMSKN